MRKYVVGLLVCATIATAGTARASSGEDVSKQQKKLTDATAVYTELVSPPDRAAPKELLENCKCVAVLPVSSRQPWATGPGTAAA
jgi:lipid-binding SYLF domain-containing protein